MKKLLLITACLFLFLNVRAQKLEITLQGNSTLSHFRGSSAVSDATIQESYIMPDSNKTNNPYGKKYAVGFNLGVQAQVITKSGFIAGLGAGYELLRSSVTINSVLPALVFIDFLPNTNYVAYGYPANGSVNLNSSYLNLSPYIGYRVQLKTVSFDIIPGAECALGLWQTEKGSAASVSNGQKYTTSYPRKMPPVDTRLKLGLTTNYQNLCINFAYARGLSNYNRNNVYPTSGKIDIKTELFRLGIGYRLQ